jgi:DNA (cytosine-5)-methyltransferase 1
MNDAAMAMGDSAEQFPPYGRYAQVVHWWEGKFTPAPYPVEVGARGKYRLNTEFAEWMMGLSAGWVTSDEIGLSRKDQLRAIGNGVCPQRATLALERLFGGGVPA